MFMRVSGRKTVLGFGPVVRDDRLSLGNENGAGFFPAPSSNPVAGARYEPLQID
jgi:hypothetical protein